MYAYVPRKGLLFCFRASERSQQGSVVARGGLTIVVPPVIYDFCSSPPGLKKGTHKESATSIPYKSNTYVAPTANNCSHLGCMEYLESTWWRVEPAVRFEEQLLVAELFLALRAKIYIYSVDEEVFR